MATMTGHLSGQHVRSCSAPTVDPFVPPSISGKAAITSSFRASPWPTATSTTHGHDILQGGRPPALQDLNHSLPDHPTVPTMQLLSTPASAPAIPSHTMAGRGHQRPWRLPESLPLELRRLHPSPHRRPRPWSLHLRVGFIGRSGVGFKSMNDLCFDVFGISKEKKDPRSIQGHRVVGCIAKQEEMWR